MNLPGDNEVNPGQQITRWAEGKVWPEAIITPG